MTNSQELKKLLAQKLATTDSVIPEPIQDQLVNYLLLLEKWNQTYNLTSVRDPKEMVTQHILDSLSIAPYLHGKNILDVGTGAGLPGIPLALTQPERQLTLLDSNGKKTRFLIHVIQSLNLTNVKVAQARAEAFSSEPCFDTIISRAFSSLADFLQKTQHLCCKTGIFLAMKGQYPSEELTAINSDFTVLNVEKLNIPGLNAERHVVLIKKGNA